MLLRFYLINVFLLQIRLKDSSSGTAELVATRPLNCEQRKNYRFDIAARSCAGIMSNKWVHWIIRCECIYEVTFLTSEQHKNYRFDIAACSCAGIMSNKWVHWIIRSECIYEVTFLTSKQRKNDRFDINGRKCAILSVQLKWEYVREFLVLFLLFESFSIIMSQSLLRSCTIFANSPCFKTPWSVVYHWNWSDAGIIRSDAGIIKGRCPSLCTVNKMLIYAFIITQSRIIGG